MTPGQKKKGAILTPFSRKILQSCDYLNFKFDVVTVTVPR